MIRTFRVTFSKDPEEVLGRSVHTDTFKFPYTGSEEIVKTDGATFEAVENLPGRPHAPRALIELLLSGCKVDSAPVTFTDDPLENDELVQACAGHLEPMPVQSPLPAENTSSFYVGAASDLVVRAFGISPLVAAKALAERYPMVDAATIAKCLADAAVQGYASGSARKRAEIRADREARAKSEAASKAAVERILRSRAVRKDVSLRAQGLCALVADSSVFKFKTDWLYMFVPSTPTLELDGNRVWIFRVGGFSLHDFEVESGVIFVTDLTLSLNGDQRACLGGKLPTLPAPVIQISRPAWDDVSRLNDEYLDLKSSEGRAVRDQARKVVETLMTERDSEVRGLATLAACDLVTAFHPKLSPTTLIAILANVMPAIEAEHAVVRAVSSRARLKTDPPSNHFWRLGELLPANVQPKEAA